MNMQQMIRFFGGIFVLLAISPLVNAFATSKCDHNNLKSQINKLSKCMEGSLDKYMDLLKIYNKVSKIYVKQLLR